MWNKLEENTNQYLTKFKRVQYTISCVAEDVVITIDTFSSTTVAVFMIILKVSYNNPNQQVTI